MKRLLQLIQRENAASPSEQVPLCSDASPYAKRVYLLSEELARDPERLAQTHELTQDRSRPFMGLAGKHGLFATAPWWQAVNSGRIPTRRVAGVITRAYRAGQDNTGPANTVVVTRSDGSSETIGIYVNHKNDRRYFAPGNFVEIIYALDDCKPQPDGRMKQADIALEVVVVVNATTA
jgi:hypothetical protein